MPIPTIWEHANSQRKTLDVIKKTSHWAVDSFTHYPDRTFVSNFRRLHEGISVACITQDHPFSTSLYKEHLDTWEYLTMRFRTKGIICFSASYYLVSNKDSICSRIYWECILTKATIRVSVFCCESLISFSLSLDTNAVIDYINNKQTWKRQIYTFFHKFKQPENSRWQVEKADSWIQQRACRGELNWFVFNVRAFTLLLDFNSVFAYKMWPSKCASVGKPSCQNYNYKVTFVVNVF